MTRWSPRPARARSRSRVVAILFVFVFPTALVPRAAAPGRRRAARRRRAAGAERQARRREAAAAADAARDRAAGPRAVQHGVPGRAGLQRRAGRRRRRRRPRPLPDRVRRLRRSVDSAAVPATDVRRRGAHACCSAGRRAARSRSSCATTPGAPVVIRNAPLLDDGTPMPTRYWLVDPELVDAGRPARVDRRRARGRGRGRRRRAAAGARALRRASATPRCRRTTTGPRPHGGVGGTRRGVKCLHAHYAYHLAGGDDPVGRWVEEHLRSDALTCRRGRHRHQLDPPARRRRRRSRPRRQARRRRPAHADHPPRPGRRPRSRAASRRDRAHARGAARVPRGDRRARRRAGARDRDERVARRDATATTSSTRPSSCSACGPSCSAARRKRASSSSGATAGLDRARAVSRRRRRRRLDRVHRRHRRARRADARSTSAACG